MNEVPKNLFANVYHILIFGFFCRFFSIYPRSPCVAQAYLQLMLFLLSHYSALFTSMCYYNMPRSRYIKEHNILCLLSLEIKEKLGANTRYIQVYWAYSNKKNNLSIKHRTSQQQEYDWEVPECSLLREILIESRQQLQVGWTPKKHLH